MDNKETVKVFKDRLQRKLMECRENVEHYLNIGNSKMADSWWGAMDALRDALAWASILDTIE